MNLQVTLLRCAPRGFTKIGDPKTDPQIVGFPDDKAPKKVPLFFGNPPVGFRVQGLQYRTLNPSKD